MNGGTPEKIKERWIETFCGSQIVGVEKIRKWWCIYILKER